MELLLYELWRRDWTQAKLMSTCKLRTTTQSSVLFSQRSFSQSISNIALDLNHNLGIFRELWNHPSLLQHFTQVIRNSSYRWTYWEQNIIFPHWVKKKFSRETIYIYIWAPEHNLTLCIQLFTQMTAMKYHYIWTSKAFIRDSKRKHAARGFWSH